MQSASSPRSSCQRPPSGGAESDVDIDELCEGLDYDDFTFDLAEQVEARESASVPPPINSTRRVTLSPGGRANNAENSKAADEANADHSKPTVAQQKQQQQQQQKSLIDEEIKGTTHVNSWQPSQNEHKANSTSPAQSTAVAVSERYGHGNCSNQTLVVSNGSIDEEESKGKDKVKKANPKTKTKSKSKPPKTKKKRGEATKTLTLTQIFGRPDEEKPKTVRFFGRQNPDQPKKNERKRKTVDNTTFIQGRAKHQRDEESEDDDSLPNGDDTTPRQLSQTEFAAFSQHLSQCYRHDDDDDNDDGDEAEGINESGGRTNHLFLLNEGEEEEEEQSCDLDNDHLQSACIGLSQNWQFDETAYPEETSSAAVDPAVSTNNKSCSLNVNQRPSEPPPYTYEPYEYTPYPPDRYGTRRYKVDEAWYNIKYPEKVYTIIGFKLRGYGAQGISALCKVSRKLNRTFLGGNKLENSHLFEGRVWIQEKEDKLVKLKELNRVIPDWEQPKIVWEQTEPRLGDPDHLRFGFAYSHHDEEHTSPFKGEDNAGPPTVLELFGGCGGMSIGLEKAGFKVEDIVEMEDRAASSLKINFKTSTVYDEDVLDFLKLAKENTVDYPTRRKYSHIHGSTPCQGFSKANRAKGGGKNGKKNNDLTREFVEAVRFFQPQTASFENVTGMLEQKHIRYLKDIVATLFFELEYNVRQVVLNAANFGDGQNRKRVFLLVSKKGLPLPKAPVPTHGIGRGLIPRRTVRDCIGDLADIKPAVGAGKILLDSGTSIWKHCSEGTQVKNETRRLDPDKPACTLYGQSTNACVHYNANRLLTIRELARLQSFPDCHDFPRNRNVARTLIQNAVPVGLAHAVAKAIFEVYEVEGST